MIAPAAFVERYRKLLLLLTAAWVGSGVIIYLWVPLTTPVMLLLFSSALFMPPVLANPTSNLARTMSMLPTSAPIIMPLRMTLVPVPGIEIVGALAGVSAACAAAIWLSGRIYRVGLLMYGKKPTIRELAKWVKEAR